MKKMNVALCYGFFALVFASYHSPQSSLQGAWEFRSGNTETVLLFRDGYFTMTEFDKVARKIIYSIGGPCNQQEQEFHCNVEFDTHSGESTGKRRTFTYKVVGDKLELGENEASKTFNRLDAGEGQLAGNWRITGRMQNGTMNQMKRGDRKTLKLLSGSRFQWMAINPATREFFGTGGGRYTFSNGKYTEQIEFFPRDSSRVGASLQFEGKVEGDVWTHTGKSSKGDALQEEWTREKK